MIGIVDYGCGNLMSVANSLEFLGFDCFVSSDADKLSAAGGLILPGVGAFPAAMEMLEASGLVGCVKGFPRPLLGICLGMQLLFSVGEEVRECAGLGLVPGRVRLIDTELKLPHIGWNSLSLRGTSPLFRGVPDGSFVYFVHSFAGAAENPADVAAVTDYGTEVLAAVSRGNVHGCQFHPEKSGDTGLKILKNFAELCV